MAFAKPRNTAVASPDLAAMHPFLIIDDTSPLTPARRCEQDTSCPHLAPGEKPERVEPRLRRVSISPEPRLAQPGSGPVTKSLDCIYREHQSWRVTIQDAKSELRQRVRARLKQPRSVSFGSASERIRQLLIRQDIWRNARAVLLYSPLTEEPDVWPLVQAALTAGKTVALPRYDALGKQYAAGLVRNPDADIHSGQFGIREPKDSCPVVPLNELDLVLVPGIAFDPGGRRLGRGKGHYDQLLPSVRGKTCGVAFDEQLVDEIPVEPHDVRLNFILTPTRWIEA
jgi:5-formyltetrahydrofolate cyclo-ligase